ncbi:hypothetical protein RHMOL_Rhmol02G0231000 [Rhododendron molle]|uniref:Uncharacterized protein n=1 Tax=Rhododendron molle TaxID=49168 RepID=A0ACC0PT11_RHOML|nr:hypothetical protein RHMOL_Rhmol02G0231000 [Rhododendron molle]
MTLLPNAHCEDFVRWMLTANDVFFTRHTIRVKAPIVPWYKAVWYGHHVLIWTHYWLAILGRLIS